MYLEAGKLFGTDEPTAKAVAAEQVRRIHGIDFRPLLAGNRLGQEAAGRPPGCYPRGGGAPPLKGL